MAQPPNPQVVPLVGPGGFVTREWLRYLQQLITAASVGDTQALAALIAAQDAQFASMANDIAEASAATAAVAADVEDLAEDVAALGDDVTPPGSTDPRIDALALEVGSLPAVVSPPVGDPCTLQPTPSAGELLSLLTELDKRVAALEQGAP